MFTICKAILVAVVIALWSTSSVAADNKPKSANLAAQMDAIQSKSDKNKKVSKSLRKLHEEFVAFKKTKGKSFKASNRNFRIDNGKVLVEVIAPSNGKAAQKILESLGGTRIDSVDHLASGYVPISVLPKLESIPFIRFVRPSYPMTRAGLVTSQGDVATRANTARSLYDVNGSGIVIGTMSDSFNCLGGAATDIANNDLPTGILFQEISNCSNRTDEGRAMMQIIHDLAPGSSQMFYTASEGRANFANGIRVLANSGADIIVDDIGYLDEPWFQDGPIAQAVDEVTTQQGVVYFSAAGNDGDHSYESVFTPDSSYNRYHDFDPTVGEDVFQEIFIPEGEKVTIAFQWSEPYASVSGAPGASTDFDIFLYDSSGAVIKASSTNQNLGLDPIEILNYTNLGAGANFNIVIDRFAGAGTPVLKYIYIGNLSVNEYATNSSTVYGHPNAAWAEATGAVNFWDTPSNNISPPEIASYSSKGGTPILFNRLGNPITSVVRDKPNISCVDGGDTTFFGQDNADPGSWPNFTGTSAAAPHAAALAALIKEYSPSLTPSQVFQVMEGTAVDMETPGFDYLTGNGLCEEVAALGSLENPEISLSVTPNPTTVPEPGGTVSFGVSVANVGSTKVTLTELRDDAVGSLDGLGSCSVPQSLVASIGTYECSYALDATGNAGDELPLVVTATAGGLLKSDTKNYETSVTITDVLPSASLSATADPASLPEPGGQSNISLLVQNTGNAESITLTSLTDSAIGDLDGEGTCTYPVTIEPGAAYQCVYSSLFNGNAGTVIDRQIDASVEDDEFNRLNIGDSVAVTITDILPTATLVALVSPTELDEPGGFATISIAVQNTGGAESITLTLLSDSQEGNLNGKGTCSTPQSIDPGITYSCAYSSEFSGEAGEDVSRQISGSVEDDDSNTIPLNGEVVVSILGSDVIFSDSFE